MFLVRTDGATMEQSVAENKNNHFVGTAKSGFSTLYLSKSELFSCRSQPVKVTKFEFGDGVPLVELVRQMRYAFQFNL